MKNKPSAKEQLSTGTVVVHSSIKGKTTFKRVDVPEWLFDLATHTDEHIFANTLAQGWDKKHIEKMSKAMFTGLLIELRANNR